MQLVPGQALLPPSVLPPGPPMVSAASLQPQHWPLPSTAPLVPALPLRRRYSTAPSSFFREVYRHARTVNCRLADHMDTCIVK